MKIARVAGYRSPPHVLRRLCQGNAVYEMPGATPAGYWDGFHIRNIGLAVQRRMAARFGGDHERMRSASRKSVSRALGVEESSWTSGADDGFDNLALVLALVPDLRRWTSNEKEGVIKIANAKMGPDEAEYLRLMQQHTRLREAIRKMAAS
jgi:hypothetical protein